MHRLRNIEKVYHGLDVNCPFKISHVYIPGRRGFFSGDIHYDLQMIIMLSGSEDVVLPEFEKSYEAGQVWLTAPWEPHAGRIARNYSGILVITISLDLLGSSVPFHEVDWLVPFTLPPSQRPTPQNRESRLRVLLLAREIIRLDKQKPYGWRTLQWLKIHEIIIFVNQLIPPELMVLKADSKKSLFSRIAPAIQMVKKKPSQLFSLDDAANLCGMGRSHFCRIFKQVMGVGFSCFALHARINCAARMLCEDGSSTKEVAFNCGFKDLAHFYHVFGKFFNCTPARFVETTRMNREQCRHLSK